MNPIENHSKTTAEVAEIKRCVPWIYYVIFFAVLNESVFNVSTPSIAGEFGLDASGVSWVVTIFFIVFGIGMVIYGKLSDMFSVKKLITIGIVTYCAGSLLGFVLQSSYPAIIVARALQGAGGSAIPALVFVMVARFFTSQERGKISASSLLSPRAQSGSARCSAVTFRTRCTGRICSCCLFP
jgi:DHA2 family metal-tetracycline-proton antiporter-like MFS transporter